jgi:hypothetical protein
VKLNQQKEIGWPLKTVILSLAVLIGFFDHALNGWGGAVLMALAALVIPVILYRRFWQTIWFRITAAALGLLQIPLIFAVKPLIEQSRPFYMLAFVMADGMIVILVILLASPKSNGEDYL